MSDFETSQHRVETIRLRAHRLDSETLVYQVFALDDRGRETEHTFYGPYNNTLPKVIFHDTESRRLWEAKDTSMPSTVHDLTDTKWCFITEPGHTFECEAAGCANRADYESEGPWDDDGSERGQCWYLCAEHMKEYADVWTGSTVEARAISRGTWTIPAHDILPARGTVYVTSVDNTGEAPIVTGYWDDETTERAVCLDPSRPVIRTV